MTTLAKLWVILAADTKPFQEGMQRAAKETAAWKRTITRSTRAISTDLRGSITEAGKARDALSASMGRVRDVIGGLRSGSLSVSDALRGTADAVRGLGGAAGSAVKAVGGLAQATLHAAGGLVQLGRYAVEAVIPQLRRAGRAILAVSGALGVGLVGALAVSGAAIANWTLEAAPVEAVRVAFEGTTAAIGESADEMLAKLRESSGGMIAGRDLMLSYNKASLMVSNDFASTLPSVMGYLSKVAASSRQNLGYLLDSYVVGTARLSGPILDNLGIQVSLADATERAAQMFGVAADELSKQQLQMGMAAVVAERLAENTASIPDATGGAAAGLARLRAMAQDAKDALGSKFLGVLDGLADALLVVGEWALPLVSGWLDRVAPIAERVAGGVRTFITLLTGGLGPLEALRGAVGQVFGPEMAARVMEIVASIQSFAEQVGEALAPVMAWVSEHVELQDVLTALGVVLASVIIPAVAGFVGSVVAAVAPIAAAFAAVVAVSAALRTAWENDLGGIQEKTAAVMGWLQGAVDTALAAVAGFWEAHGEQILAIWALVTADVRDVFDAFKAAFQGDWEAFGEALRSVWDRNWEAIKGAVDAAIEWMKGIDWGAVGRGIIDGIVAGLQAGAQWLYDTLTGIAESALEAAKGFLGIQSPSTEFRWVGQMMMAGMKMGIEKAAALPEIAVEAAVRGLPMVAARTVAQEPRPARPQIIIYGGLTLSGVSDAEGLLAQLQALAA